MTPADHYNFGVVTARAVQTRAVEVKPALDPLIVFRGTQLLVSERLSYAGDARHVIPEGAVEARHLRISVADLVHIDARFDGCL